MKVVPLKVIMLILTLVIMLGSVSLPARAQPLHQIIHNPSSGQVGTVVTVTVSGPGLVGSGDLYFNGVVMHSFSGFVPLVTDFTVPDLALGYYPVREKDVPANQYQWKRVSEK